MSLKILIHLLLQKLDDVEKQFHESEIRCDDLAEDNEKLLEQLRLQHKELQAEKLTTAQVRSKVYY